MLAVGMLAVGMLVVNMVLICGSTAGSIGGTLGTWRREKR
jgi:hypothetical protein